MTNESGKTNKNSDMTNPPPPPAVPGSETSSSSNSAAEADKTADSRQTVSTLMLLANLTSKTNKEKRGLPSGEESKSPKKKSRQGMAV